MPAALARLAASALALGAVFTLAAQPQQAPAPQAAPAAFDVVSVKLANPNVAGRHFHQTDDPGRLSLLATTHDLILRAYAITDKQLAGEPDWFPRRLYRIDAVTAAPATPAQMLIMLRAALADRFQLRLREEQRPLPAYSLELAPGGPKFKELPPGAGVDDHGPDPPGYLKRSFSSVTELVNLLNHVTGGVVSLDRIVIDNTGLTGQYLINLLTPMEILKNPLGNSAQLPDLFHDLQSQLGLKLTPRSVSMPYYTVERSALPGDN
jgi:uncharacterized protein (TIGR03435 family)